MAISRLDVSDKYPPALFSLVGTQGEYEDNGNTFKIIADNSSVNITIMDPADTFKSGTGITDIPTLTLSTK